MQSLIKANGCQDNLFEKFTSASQAGRYESAFRKLFIREINNLNKVTKLAS